MEPVKNNDKVRKMFARGEPFLVDPQTGYKYTMTARCPRDGGYGGVSKIDKAGQSLTGVTFQCTTCFKPFQPKQEDIYIQ